MTDKPKDISPKTLRWLNKNIPAFRQARKTCGDVIDKARIEADKRKSA